tara:strand:+ start:784 stop:2292 length:1509 start_codon:yes stop_codon:yes gene_type:complete
MPELFGFSFGRKRNPDGPLSNVKSFVPPDHDDGATQVATGAFYGQYVDLQGDQKSDNGFIKHYRTMILQPEVELAVQDIVNEGIVFDEYRTPVKLNMEQYEQSDSIKEKINNEFKEVLSLLDFNNRGVDIFKKWFVDSRLYFHKIIDEKNKKKGIIEIRPIDPIQIKKIREVKKEKNKDGIDVIKSVNEFYMYDMSPKNKPYIPQFTTKGLKISPDAICYVTSGLFDGSKRNVIGYLHKAIRPLNQLRMIEDSVVIYRISRAPERRVFYVDVGNLPKNKAEQYLKQLMNQYKNKLVYDADTGEIKDDKRHMNMLEDYWLPRREGGRGTEITTLDGGQNLGEMEDVDYFQKKLFRALNIPISRLEAENGFNMGRSAEITRDEIRFFKFITRIRAKFSDLFLDLMKTQLILKGIITPDDWKKISQNVYFEFATDSYFTELKESEILKERMEVLREVNEYIGKYYSIDYIRKNILKFTETEIKNMDKQISKEKKSGLYKEEEEEF